MTVKSLTGKQQQRRWQHCVHVDMISIFRYAAVTFLIYFSVIPNYVATEFTRHERRQATDRSVASRFVGRLCYHWRFTEFMSNLRFWFCFSYFVRHKYYWWGQEQSSDANYSACAPQLLCPKICQQKRVIWEWKHETIEISQSDEHNDSWRRIKQMLRKCSLKFTHTHTYKTPRW